MHRLYVLPTVKHVLLSTFNNFGFAFHVSWPWMLALLPLNVAVNVYAFSYGLTAAPQKDPYFVGMNLLLIFAITVAFSSIAVAWHRYVLLDEIPHGWNRLRIDSVVWRYIGNTLLIMLILFCAGFVIGFIVAFLAGIVAATAGKGFSYLLLVPSIIALILFGITTAFRMMIKLPAVALGRRDYRLGHAWRDSAGSFWPILGFVVLISIVLSIFGGMVSLVAIPLASLGLAGISVSLLFQLAMNWFGTIVGVTMLTSLYGIFYEGRTV